jgi:predicted  nucleic acid-binding Zn-ribbon protein
MDNTAAAANGAEASKTGAGFISEAMIILKNLQRNIDTMTAELNGQRGRRYDLLEKEEDQLTKRERAELHDFATMESELAEMEKKFDQWTEMVKDERAKGRESSDSVESKVTHLSVFCSFHISDPQVNYILLT